MGETIRLLKRDDVVERTMGFHFTRPSGLDFRAGQSVDLTLIDLPETDAEGNVRTFSIASAFFEDHMAVATRMRGTAFKRALRGAREGLELKMDGPSGSFDLHRNVTKPAVFLRW